MALTFDNHLLQSPDGLVATFLRHLAGKEVFRPLGKLVFAVLRLFLGLLGLLLVLIGSTFLRGLLQSIHGSTGSGSSVDLIRSNSISPARRSFGCVVDGLIASLLALFWGLEKTVDALKGIKQITYYRLVSVNLLLEASLEFVLGEVGLLMPDVVLGGLVNLGQLIVGWPNAGCAFCGGISGDVTKEDHSVVHYPEISPRRNGQSAP